MPAYDRHNPFLSKIISRSRLNNAGCSRETWHFILDLQDSDIEYAPGDSVGIIPENDPKKVEKIIKELAATGDEIVDDGKGQKYTFRDYLRRKANLAHPTRKLFQEIALLKKGALEKLLEKENEEALKKYLTQVDVEELIAEQQVQFEPTLFCKLLAPLLPRLYSIASAKSCVGHQVHLTVARVRYQIDSKERRGICSHFLCDLANENEASVPLYLQPTRDFRLPQNDATPIIMIGPGTGVAPFRSFMQERISRGAPSGKCWLFFGERNRKTDFFYEECWNKMIASGMLQVDVAFSRDQEEKIYVQDRMWQKKEEFWQWLVNGAVIYVCGDASRMAKDVDHTLHKIAQSEGKLDEIGARDFIKALRLEKRYIKDVY